MRFYIPSYKRADSCITVDYLRGCGVQSSDIYISTQTEQDYAQYLANYGCKCNVIYRKGDNVAMNRNTCIQHARKEGVVRFCMLDDDIDCIMSFLPKRNTRIEGARFADFMRGIEKTLEQGASIVGLYPISNNMFALSQKRATRAMLTGCFLAFGTTDYLFDEEYRIKEDYELCLRMMSRNKCVLRLNWYYAKASLHKKGGCFSDFQSGASEEFSKRLLMIYPDLIKKSRRAGEIVMK